MTCKDQHSTTVGKTSPCKSKWSKLERRCTDVDMQKFQDRCGLSLFKPLNSQRNNFCLSACHYTLDTREPLHTYVSDLFWRKRFPAQHGIRCDLQVHPSQLRRFSEHLKASSQADKALINAETRQARYLVLRACSNCWACFLAPTFLCSWCDKVPLS